MSIYADNAATTPPSKRALAEYLRVATDYFGNPSSVHDLGLSANNRLCSARDKIKQLLHCAKDDKIIFTSCGSEANTQAILSAANYGRKIGRNRIVCSNIEHESVLKTVEHLKNVGFDVVFARADKNGYIAPNAVEELIDDKTCLVSVMTANNEIGTIQPIVLIGKICRANGALFHTDAVQAVGHLPIYFCDLNADYLTFSAHKFGGVRGAGALVAKRSAPISSLIFGGSQEYGKRAGTENIPAVCAMAVALEESLCNPDNDRQFVRELTNTLIDELLKIPDSHLNGDRKNRLDGIVNLSFDGIDSESLLLLLNMEGIYASAASACQKNAKSHVIKAIGGNSNFSIRLSFCNDNTKEEVSVLAKTITEKVVFLRNIRTN